MKGPDRRQILGALAASTGIVWLAEGRAIADHSRARAGATITLQCADAHSWKLEVDGRSRVVQGAYRTRFRAPFLGEQGGFADLRCTPLDATGQPVGTPAVVQILRAPLLFGA